MTTINQPSKVKIENLLGGTGNRVQIPSYQRSFSWSLDQAKDLYLDLVRFQIKYPGNRLDSAEYFLGSIVGVRDGKTLKLVDGQQRIATLTILLSSIRDAFAELNDVTNADELQKQLIQERIKPGTALLDRLTLSVYDKNFFNAYIQRFPRDAGASVELASHRQITRVRKYFDNALQEGVKDSTDFVLVHGIKDLSNSQAVDWLIRLWLLISSCLVLVVVEASTEEDATEVFEVLNERGVGLSTIDLLRNFLLGRAKNEHERQQIVTCWAEVFAVSDNPTWVQNFLRHFWIARHGDVKARGLYREIKHSLETSFGKHESNPVQFSIDLSVSADTYSQLLAPPSTPNEELNTVLEAIATVGATPLYPAILSSVEKHGDKAATAVARALLSHYVRWTVIGRRESTELEKQVFKIAREIYSGILSAEQAIRAIKEVTLADDKFIVEFARASLNKPGHRRHILESFENYMRTETEQDEVEPKSPSELHVEHIDPQTPKDDESKLPDHEEWVERIANITLLAKRWNTKIKNGDFANVKRPEFKKSIILLNQWIQQQKSWGPQQIEQRQELLANEAPKVWPLD